MVSPRRLFTFDSNRLLLLVVIAVATGILLIEKLYNLNHVQYDFGVLTPRVVNSDPNPKIIAIGDCRALFGISADSMARYFPGYSVYNLSTEAGVLHDELLSLRDIPNCKFVIAGINPATTYPTGEISHKTIKTWLKNTKLIPSLYLTLRRYIVRPNIIVDSILRSNINRRLNITYGFCGISDLILSGKISYSVSPKGWVKYLIQGSDRTYGEILNYYTYKNHLLLSSESTISQVNQYLDEDLAWFRQNHIRVLLIRIPVSSKMLAIENEAYPWFNSFIDSLAQNHDCRYISNFPSLNLPKENTDGSHLTIPMAVVFSKYLSENVIRIE